MLGENFICYDPDISYNFSYLTLVLEGGGGKDGRDTRTSYPAPPYNSLLNYLVNEVNDGIHSVVFMIYNIQIYYFTPSIWVIIEGMS